MQTTPETHNHRRQSLHPSPPLSLSLSLSLFLFRSSVFLATRQGRCFTSQEWKLKGVGASISRRLLIHDYRPPCGIHFRNAKWPSRLAFTFLFISSLVVLNSSRVFERPQLRGLHFYFIYSSKLLSFENYFIYYIYVI